MKRASLARHIGAKVTKSTQTTLQADSRTLLTVVGETSLPLIRHGRPLTLEDLVADLDVAILTGAPFEASNNIAACPANVRSSSLGVTWCPLVVPSDPNTNTIVWPGEFLEIDAPSELLKDATLDIEQNGFSLF